MTLRVRDVDSESLRDETRTLWLDKAAPNRRLLIAALDAFASRGYHATTTREIGQGAGMSPAAVYTHYASKAQVLMEIVRTGHDLSWKVVQQALGGVTDPVERVMTLVETFSSWQASHLRLSRVCSYELGALEPADYSEILISRRRFDELLRADLVRGVEEHKLRMMNVDIMATAILSMCVDVARWYSHDKQAPEDIGAAYSDIVFNAIQSGPS